MNGVPAGRRVLLATLAGACLLLAPRAQAFEAFDGRIQAHGYVEAQLRAIDRNFKEELDLAQWYNILNVELEFDIAPDGWGPIDLMEAFVRLEGRFDCIYSRGCGMMRSANTYGDRAKRLPWRLRTATDRDYTGVLGPLSDGVAIMGKEPATLPAYRTVTNKYLRTPYSQENQTWLPEGWVPGEPWWEGKEKLPPWNEPEYEIRKRRAGSLRAFFSLPGPDLVLGNEDDPGRYTFEAFVEDYKFALIDVLGPESGAVGILGPWLPKNFVNPLAVLQDRANPRRGFETPAGGFRCVGDILYTGSRGVVCLPAEELEPLDERLVRFVGREADEVGQPLRGVSVDTGNEVTIDPAARLANGLPAIPGNNVCEFDYWVDLPNRVVKCKTGTEKDGRSQREPFFGGDYSANVPCVPPDTTSARALRLGDTLEEHLGGANFAAAQRYPCLPGLDDQWQMTDPAAGRIVPGTNIKVTGGVGENPLSPAPDRASSQDPSTNRGLLEAQGLYMPNAGLRHALRTRDLDSLEFNFREAEREWNRGASQQDQKELKEAYVDLEFLDSRLWARVGLQSIVWGKTELFRTTDQFNPVDLALSNLPSLEEQRIALWAARFVYSFYDVGPLEDVRFELAFNFDQFEPNDLGACGEPYTFDLVCGLTTGILFHGAVGVGVAGVDRPPSPWESVKGWEMGFRWEARVGPFSLALSDFYGYNDIPYPDRIFTYERRVDPATGRLLVANGFGLPRGNSEAGKCDDLGPGGDPGTGPVPTAPYDASTPWQDRLNALREQGIGTRPDCLKAGGAPGGLNENLYGGAQNALYFHHANQQLYSVICSVTVGISPSLAASACGMTLLASPDDIFKDVPTGDVTAPFVEYISGLFAGEPHGDAQFLQKVYYATKGEFPTGQHLVATVALNRDSHDGQITATSTLINKCESAWRRIWDEKENKYVPIQVGKNCTIYDVYLGGLPMPPPYEPGQYWPSQFELPAGHSDDDWLTLDSTLTAEQRALLGCGPFLGTRCDTSVQKQVRYLGISLGLEWRFPRTGGIDLLNAEASALFQAWPGFEGTGVRGLNGFLTEEQAEFYNHNYLPPGASPVEAAPFWTTQATSLLQPGTFRWSLSEWDLARWEYVGKPHGEVFYGGPACTREVDGELVTLPGCRGVEDILQITVPGEAGDPDLDLPAPPLGGVVDVLFEKGYDTSVDGCVLARTIKGRLVRGWVRAEDGSYQTVDLQSCWPAASGGSSDTKQGGLFGASVRRDGARTIYHTYAGCLTDEIAFTVDPAELLALDGAKAGKCSVMDLTVTTALPGVTDVYPLRDYDADFLVGKAQIFQSEMKAFSYNFLVFMMASSCNYTDVDEFKDHDPRHVDNGGTLTYDPECYDPRRPFRRDGCSMAMPYECRNVKSFFGLAGVRKNTRRAGGTWDFGRRVFLWHSGGDLILSYEKRNVFGFGADFAEDVTKTNWGLEFTWIEGLPFIDNRSMDNISRSDEFNLTISVDRPTFVNFLNPNRTFFFNTQWFFRYRPGHKKGFTENGPLNVLFTVAVFTGYFQDRLLPNFVTVFDINSRSGAFLPSLRYRFNESFSATVGMEVFFGRTELVEMPVNEFGPAGNRAGRHAYMSPQDNMLSNFRKRDEIFLRMSYTF